MNDMQPSIITTHQNRKREVNITPIERLGRILVGFAGVVGGIILLVGSPTLLTGTLEVLLVVAGLDLVVTGATGHCPLYAKLGHTPTSLKKKEDNHEHDGHENCH